MSEFLALSQPGAVGEDGAANAPPLVLLPAPGAVERLLALAHTQLGMEVALVSEFTQDRQVVRIMAGDSQAFGLQIGGSAPLFDTYCWNVVRGYLPRVIPDARADVRARDLEVTWEGDIGSYIGVPIRFSDGRIHGSLCCLSHSANPSLRERDADFMIMLAGLIAQELETECAARTRRLETIERIRGVLERGGLGVVFRPIFDLGSLSIVGYEALTRFEDGGSPEEWFAEAADIGLGPDLERAAIQVAIAHLIDLPERAFLWVNLSSSAMGSSTVSDMIGAVGPNRIIVALRPTDPDDEPRLQEAVRDLRASGFRVAIDPMGSSGSASLGGICRLQPDVLRLNAAAVRAIDADPSQRDVISFLMQFGAEMGAVLVAEGIETRRTLDVLRDLGVAYGQGYALAPPLTLADLAHERP
jgi:EAL domain-containing protein (putative c-di-GMP-specific phosphodiesterase class I)